MDVSVVGGGRRITRVPSAVSVASSVAASVVVVLIIVVAPVVAVVSVPVAVPPPPPPPPPTSPTTPPVPPNPVVIVTTVPVEGPVVRPVVTPIPVVVVTPVVSPTVVAAIPVRKIPVVEVVGDVVTIAVGVVEETTLSTTFSSFRTSDPTPVGLGSVVGATNPTALTRGELVNEVVFSVGSDGSEVTTLSEVITRAAVVVSRPEVQSSTSGSGDPFVVVTSGGEVFDVGTKIPNNNTIAVVV